MARTRSKISNSVLFTWCMLAGFILLLCPHSLTGKFQFAFAHIFRLPLGVSRSILLSARTTGPVRDVVSRREYNKLLNNLANIAQQRDQAIQKVETLSGFHRNWISENVKFIPAEVIKGSNTDIVINCGQDCSLSKGQFVLGDNSIIGSIYDVWSQTAQVRLVTNPKSKIAVRISRLNIDAVMKGDGNGTASIRLIPAKYKVRVGDEVFAVKASGLLSVPMIIGRVSGCRPDDSNPLLWDITVKPVCEMDKLSDVIVITPNQQK